jgi:hypothetical protein
MMFDRLSGRTARDRIAALDAELAAARVHVGQLAAHLRAMQPGEVPPGSFWPPSDPPSFYADNLAIWAKGAPFLDDERFLRAYRRGMQSGHHMGRPRGSTLDIHLEWRAYVVAWAALHGARLPGDFVECGVNTGIYALTVCEYLDFNALDRDYWLFDTFRGVTDQQLSARERAAGRSALSAAFYSECYDLAQRNFAPFARARLVRGSIPETLDTVDVKQVAFLSIDMNVALPERAALAHFWPRLSPGACVVLDDYGWHGHEEQRDALDGFAAEAGVRVLALPTGQGLIIKPPEAGRDGAAAPRAIAAR